MMDFSAKGALEFAVDPLLISAGQPTAERLSEVLGAGAVVVSLRAKDEDPFDQEALIASHGGVFERLETSPASYADSGYVDAMVALLTKYRDGKTKVYFHCGSANRTGAAWALYRSRTEGLSAADAIAAGRAAGMTRLEERILGLLS